MNKLSNNMSVSDVNYFNIEDLDLDKIKFPVVNKKTKKFIKMYIDKMPFGIKIPNVTVNFDTKTNMFFNTELSVSINHPLIDAITVFENKIIQYATDLDWIDQDEKYIPFLKGTNGRFSPYIKFKFPVKDSVYHTQVYDISNSDDKDHDSMDIDPKHLEIKSSTDLINLFKKGTMVNILATASCIWFMNERSEKTWGIGFRLDQVHIIKEKKITVNNECLFLDSSSDSDF